MPFKVKIFITSIFVLFFTNTSYANTIGWNNYCTYPITTAVEKEICASPYLSDLERKVNRQYDRLLIKARSNRLKDRLSAQQISWIGQRNSCESSTGNIAACLGSIYRIRLSQLHLNRPY